MMKTGLALPRERRQARNINGLTPGLGVFGPVETQGYFRARPKPPDPKGNAVPAGPRNGAKHVGKAGAFEGFNNTIRPAPATITGGAP